MSKIQEYRRSEHYIPVKTKISLGVAASWAMLPSFPILPSFLGISSYTYCSPVILRKCGWLPLLYPTNCRNLHQGCFLHFCTTGDQQALAEPIPIDSWNGKKARQKYVKSYAINALMVFFLPIKWNIAEFISNRDIHT